MKSKFFKVVLASALALSVSSVASAAGLQDINVPWAKDSIDKMIAKGALTGYEHHIPAGE